MFSFNRLQNLFPFNPAKSSGYGIFDDFISNVLPMIESNKNRNRMFAEKDLRNERRYLEDQKNQDRQFELQRGALANIGKQVAMPEPEQSQQMNTVYQPFINPYQQAILDLRNRALDNQIDTRAASGDIADRRIDLLEAGGNRLEQIAATGKNAMDRTVVTGQDALARNTATNNAIMARVNRQAEIQLTLEKLKNTQGIEAAKVRAELERELIGLRGDEARETKAAPSEQQPLMPSQEHILRLDRAKQIKNTHPEWADYINIDDKGFTVFSGDPVIDKQINDTIYEGKVNRTSDIDLKVPEKDKLPKGSKPGGKWITTKNGRIYVDP